MTAAEAADEMLAIADEFGAARSVDQLCHRFHAAVGGVGEFFYALGRFRPHTPRDQGVILVHYPETWQRHYRANRYIEIDPTIDSITQRNGPYVWDQLSSLDVQRRRLFDDVRDLGVGWGLTVPIHMADGSTFLASFGARATNVAQRHKLLLSLAAAQFVERYATLSDPPAPTLQLTPRERDCLTWTARGKSAWEIGVLLGISENTVNFHIKQACAKLGSHGRIQGVVRAIMLGLISP